MALIARVRITGFVYLEILPISTPTIVFPMYNLCPMNAYTASNLNS